MTDETPLRDTERDDDAENPLHDDAVAHALAHLATHDADRASARNSGTAVPDALDPFADVSDTRKRAYLRAMALTGNRTRAAQLAGVPRTNSYFWEQQDPDFARQFAIAERLGADVLEAEAIRRATEGVLEPTGWYKGEPGGYVRKYSDTLLIFLLKGLKPDRHGDKLRVSGAMARLDVSRLPPHVLDALAESDDPSEVLNQLGRDVTKLLEGSQEPEGGDDGED